MLGGEARGERFGRAAVAAWKALDYVFIMGIFLYSVIALKLSLPTTGVGFLRVGVYLLALNW